MRYTLVLIVGYGSPKRLPAVGRDTVTSLALCSMRSALCVHLYVSSKRLDNAPNL